MWRLPYEQIGLVGKLMEPEILTSSLGTAQILVLKAINYLESRLKNQLEYEAPYMRVWKEFVAEANKLAGAAGVAVQEGFAALE